MPSRRLRRLDSLPSDVTAYDVSDRPGHVVLSSTRLFDKLTATINALNVDCRRPGARNRGNGVSVTSRRHSNSAGHTAATRDRTPATNGGAKWEIPRAAVVRDRLTPTNIAENATMTQRPLHLGTEIESETPTEIPGTRSDPSVDEYLIDSTHATEQTQHQQHQQQYSEDRQCRDEDVTVMTMDVTLDKGPLGLGFCIDGGLDAPDGPSPIIVKRLFKGASHFRQLGVSGVATVGYRDPVLTFLDAWLFL